MLSLRKLSTSRALSGKLFLAKTVTKTKGHKQSFKGSSFFIFSGYQKNINIQLNAPSTLQLLLFVHLGKYRRTQDPKHRQPNGLPARSVPTGSPFSNPCSPLYKEQFNRLLIHRNHEIIVLIKLTVLEL